MTECSGVRRCDSSTIARRQPMSATEDWDDRAFAPEAVRTAGRVGSAPRGAAGDVRRAGEERRQPKAYAPQRDRRPLHAVSFQGIGWGGKSELRRAVRRVIPGQGDLKESGTENIPPPGVPVPDRRAVRVKRCGKSAPRPPQGGWQAKPRTEQDRIGRRSRAARPKPPGRLLDPAGDGGARGMVAARRRPVRGRRRVQNSAYRPSAALFRRVVAFRRRRRSGLDSTMRSSE